MSKKERIKYTDEPIQLGEEVANFLPRPEDLILRPKVKKVTITLDEKSIVFFKEQAEKLNTSYQRMIRNLLAEYVSREQERTQNRNP